MRSVGSLSEIADYFNETIKSRATDTLVAGKFVANKVKNAFSKKKVSLVSLFMSTTKGRDKICSLI